MSDPKFWVIFFLVILFFLLVWKITSRILDRVQTRRHQ